MTPEEYIKIEIDQYDIIERSKRTIQLARIEANKTKRPKNVRPATANDIVQGQIIWRTRKEEFGGNYWNIVSRVLYPPEMYIADDGCRYGLDEAFVVNKKKQLYTA